MRSVSHKGKRTCISCRSRKDREELVPLYKLNGRLYANLYAARCEHGSGKGFYICPKKSCLLKAFKKLSCENSVQIFLENALIVIAERISKTAECGGPGSSVVIEKLEIISSRLITAYGL